MDHIYLFEASWGNVKIVAENEDKAISVFFQIDTAKTGSHFHFIKHKVIS